MKSVFVWKVSGEVDGLPTTVSGKASTLEMALFEANQNCNQLAQRGVVARVTNITVDAVAESDDNKRARFEEDWAKIVAFEPKPVGANFGALDASGEFFWWASEPSYLEEDAGWFGGGECWIEPAIRFAVTDYWNRCYLVKLPSGQWVTRMTYGRDRVRAAYHVVDFDEARS
jgi:hypothetical protein